MHTQPCGGALELQAGFDAPLRRPPSPPHAPDPLTPHLCAQRLQGQRLLIRRVVWHADEGVEAVRGGDEREADAGAADRALGNQAAGREAPVRQGFAHHLQSHPVRHAAPRVHELGHGQDLQGVGMKRRSV